MTAPSARSLEPARLRRERLRMLVSVVGVLGVIAARPVGAAPDRRIPFVDSQIQESARSATDPRPRAFFPDVPGRLFRTRACYFNGRLDDGIMFSMTLYNWRYAFLDNWGLFVLVVEPDGVSHVYEETVDASHLSVATDTLAIRFGSSVIEASRTGYTVVVHIDSFACELTLTNVLAPRMTGSDAAVLSGAGYEMMRLAVPAPWAAMRGWFTFGGKTVNARGQCYGDMSQSVLPLNRQNSPVVAMRAYAEVPPPDAGSWFLSVLRYTVNAGYGGGEIPVLILAREGLSVASGDAFDLAPEELSTSTGTPVPFPQRYGFRWAESGSVLEGEFVVDKITHVVDVFQRIPAPLRALVSVFLKRPVILHWIGRFAGVARIPGRLAQQLNLHVMGEYMEVR